MNAEALINALLIADTNSLGLLDVAFATLIPAILAIPVALIYRHTQRHASYTSMFAKALLLFASLTSVVTMIIGGNIARAFGLVGALSIVRFRNALKSPIDTVYIFWSLVIGMACGSGYYLAAVVFNVMICGLALVMDKVSFGERKSIESIIRVFVGSSDEDAVVKGVESLFGQHGVAYTQLNVLHDSSSEVKTYVYSLRGKHQDDLDRIYDVVREAKGVNKVYQANNSPALFAA